MMKVITMKKCLSPVALALLASTQSVAHGVDLNYETLSSLEKPIAAHVGDTTIELSGLVDGGFYTESDGNVDTDDSDTAVTGNFQVSAETQLDNSLTVGAAYSGAYTSEEADSYTDNAAVYVGGTLGILSAGDVTGLVREQARRNRGAGNAALSYDSTLGELEDRGVAYIGRYGPTRFVVALDDEGNKDLGAIFQRPLGNTDYRFSMQYRESEYTVNDATTFDSKALLTVAELTYGSTVYDLGLGLEELSLNGSSFDRKYLSVGMARKMGVLTLSAEAHLGDIEGQDEKAYSLGAGYDIARGISFNAGLNHSESIVLLDGTSLADDDVTEGTVSLRYSF